MMTQKIIPGVKPSDMEQAHHARVRSTREGEKLIHHLEVAREDGEVLRHEDGSPVRWSGRTYGQYMTNAGHMTEKYNLTGAIDDSGIIRE